jgi:hypothetical protein
MVIGGVTITLSGIVDLIILIGALCAAIYKIWDFFAKPTSAIKQKRIDRQKALILAVLDEELPKRLKDHDLETRDRYKADRQKYLTEIKDAVIKDVGGTITENKDDLEALKISAKDVLREKIMGIYYEYKAERAFPTYKKEALNQYYKDYKKLNGNSYIDKYYARMSCWKEIFDDYEDDL